MSLKPQNLIQAAEADLRRRERNVARHKGLPLGGFGLKTEQYAFHAPHVRRARDAKHLLEMALKRPGAASKSTKRNTRLIYGDAALLAHAIGIA